MLTREKLPTPPAPSGAAELSQGRFAIESLEDRIAPAGGLLDLNLNLNIQNVTVNITDVNLVVSGNVIQVGLLGGTMTGTVTSSVVNAS